MKCALSVVSIVGCLAVIVVGQDVQDFNEVNADGSFSFGLKTNDKGGHYHEASGNAKTVIRGRYGSRNPSNGLVEETVYTAGRRGFRARGPAIHRKMDLSQVPRGPIGTPDDPNADPFDDPAYGFGFKTPSYSRREDQDRFGRLNGQYSFIDDVGERHLVRYAASPQNGFEVTNSYPDAPQNVRYSSPLYKDPNRKARGRWAMQRKSKGQYSFIASAPDHRRSESVGADGITRGSYSYLDDKGVQRTVQYIAGAGIGFRIVQSTTGPGTHNLPRPAKPEFNVFSQQSNDLPAESLLFDDTPNTVGFNRPLPPVRDDRTPDLGNNDDANGVFTPVNKKPADPAPEFYPTPLPPSSIGDPNSVVPDIISGPTPPSPTLKPRPRRPTPPSSNRGSERRRSHEHREFFGVNTVDVDKARIRAHVQNIDLLPVYPRYPSPGEALKWDVIRGV